jgi:hypothetical protein
VWASSQPQRASISAALGQAVLGAKEVFNVPSTKQEHAEAFWSSTTHTAS